MRWPRVVLCVVKARNRLAPARTILFGAAIAPLHGCDGDTSAATQHVTLEAGSDGESSAADVVVIEDAAPLCDAVHLPGSSDDAGESRRDAAARAANDAGMPPSDCLAPCVWELVKDCLPQGQCVSQAYGPRSSFFSYSELMCVPGTGWAGTRDVPSSLRTSGHSVSIYVDDRFCYGFSASQMSGVASLHALWWTAPTGPRASVIAGPTGAGIPGIIGLTQWGPVACGTAEALAANLECVQNRNCPDGSGVTFYDVDPDQPHCAAWRDIAYAAYGSFSCRKGCCP